MLLYIHIYIYIKILNGRLHLLCNMSMGATEAENECYVTDEGKFIPLLEMSNLFNQFILFLGQVINLSSYIRHFNVLMSLVGDKEREEFMLKANATLFTERDIMLLKIKV